MKDARTAKSWFVIIIGDKERRGPFEVTRRALVLSVAFLIALLAAVAVASSWLYSRPYVSASNRLAEELTVARQSIDVVTREKAGLSEEVKTLQAKIAASREKRASAEEKRGQAVAVEKAAIEDKSFVSLEEIQVVYSAENKTLKVRFIIKSQSADEHYTSGYVFIILNPAHGSSASYKSSPVAELSGGFPRSYKKGENFSIARFKHIEGVFSSIPDRSKYASVSILVYADDGTLRLKKELSL